MPATRHTFSKAEKLCSRAIIQRLFSGNPTYKFNQYPLMGIWAFTALPQAVPAQVLFSVSKRNFKKAVDRNRLRRQMRESYRLNKAPFYIELAGKEAQCALAIIYIAKEAVPYKDIEKACKSILQAAMRSQ